MSIISDRYNVTVPAVIPTLPPRTENFEFMSSGPNGAYNMAARFTISVKDFSRADFGFGVITGINDLTGDYDLDDQIRTNNGDKDKIFATVAYLTLSFLQRNRRRYVFFEGSTAGRTREYQMNLANHFEVLTKYVNIFGIDPLTLQPVLFVPNTVNYAAFVILLK